MATTDGNHGGTEIDRDTISVEAVKDSDEQAGAQQGRRPMVRWSWLGLALLWVGGAGMVAGLYVVPWATQQGKHGVALAGTWLFLVAAVVWAVVSIVGTWYLVRGAARSFGMWIKAVVSLSPKANAEVIEK